MNKKIPLISVMLLSFLFSFYVFKKDVNNEQKEYSSKNIIENESEMDESVTGYPMEAAKWYYEQRAYPLGYIPTNWREQALNHIEAYNKPKYLRKVTQALTWTELGPGNIGGRIRAIVVNPTNANIVYLGSVSGGIWKTTNGGTSWFPLDDHMANLAVCSMVMDPHNSNVIYAGTGEGFNNYDYIRGAGIFKSIDAGATWNQLSSTNNSNFYFVNRLVIDSATNSIYAATRAGLFKSTDGGSSFTESINAASNSEDGCMDVIVNYTNPTTIFTTLGLFTQSQIWRSTDSGNTFKENYSQSGMGRIEIAGSSSNPLVAYASFMDLKTYQVGFMAYTANGGNNWNSITNIPGPATDGSATYTGKQGWYNNTLAVDPTNSSTIWAGGIDLWRSTDSGTNWYRFTNAYKHGDLAPFVHPDMHTIVFAPSNPGVMYVGNDGGIYVTDGLSWNAINNNLFITQFYYGTVSPTGTNYYGGTQDNYTLKSTGSQNWTNILGGDGGVVQVDYDNPNIIYAEQPNFTFFKSLNGGAKFNYADTGMAINTSTHETTDRTLFITPFTMDPNNPSILIAGTYRLWKTSNSASTWDTLSGDLTGEGSSSSANDYISAITIAKGNSSVIYVGCTNGKLWFTTDGGSTWNERDNNLPNAWCKGIAINNGNSSIAYITFSGFLSNEKVYKTTDYGNTWTNVSGDLPNIPVNCILLNPYANGYLYVGTDLGVFSSTNDGTNWIQENNGLANVSVASLVFRSSDTTMYAATHGRGMFSTSLPNYVTSITQTNEQVPDNFKIYQNYPNPFNPSTSIEYELPKNGFVKLFIYNIKGEEINSLVDSFQSAGRHRVVWNGKNMMGQDVSSGIYMYSVKFGNNLEVKKMIKLK